MMTMMMMCFKHNKWVNLDNGDGGDREDHDMTCFFPSDAVMVMMKI